MDLIITIPIDITPESSGKFVLAKIEKILREELMDLLYVDDIEFALYLSRLKVRGILTAGLEDE